MTTLIVLLWSAAILPAVQPLTPEELRMLRSIGGLVARVVEERDFWEAEARRLATWRTELELWHECHAGAYVSLRKGCESADKDNDGDVDQTDFGLLQSAR